MTVEAFYVCDECRTRVDGSVQFPPWWNLCKLGVSDDEAKVKYLCSVGCLKVYVDRKYSLEQSWHFFVKTETHPPRGFALCNPKRLVFYFGGGAEHPKVTDAAKDVTCPACKNRLEKEPELKRHG